jgi:hypothetical protein
MIIDKIDKRLKTFFSENLQNETYFVSSYYDYRNEAGFCCYSAIQWWLCELQQLAKQSMNSNIEDVNHTVCFD